jgi:hypothetical protein
MMSAKNFSSPSCEAETATHLAAQVLAGGTGQLPPIGSII